MFSVSFNSFLSQNTFGEMHVLSFLPFGNICFLTCFPSLTPFCHPFTQASRVGNPLPRDVPFEIDTSFES